MATVYQAQDLRHSRRVALKVLRPELAAVIGAQRFLAEIRTTANLQHPHILPLHDSGEVDGTVFYVMPFMEGESLRDRLNREKQLPVEDAIRLTREVAAALDYAHRHGVIHRDIKPENILLHDGSAVVADFGIALAVSRTDGGSRMTETGMSLGTPHYMSPEQAMGERELTPRSDVYALGCVLYEMLVGEPPFTGPTPQAIVAKVITEKPPNATTARDSVPVHVTRTIQKALAKLPADRFGSAADMAAALVSGGQADGRPETDRPSVRSSVLAASLLLAAALAAWGWLRPGPARVVTSTYVRLEVPHDPGWGSVDISPDGSQIAYMRGGMLWRKLRGELREVPIAGTERAIRAIFSPNGRWIAFFADGKLKMVPAEGGSPVTLGEAPSSNYWGNWIDDTRIVYAGANFSLVMVSREGGAPEVVVEGQAAARAPVGVAPIPGGAGFFFANCGVNCSPSEVLYLDLKSRKITHIMSDAFPFAWLPSGHLLYVVGSSGELLAAPLDLGSLTLRGPGVPVLENRSRFGPLSFSTSGTLIYEEGRQGIGTVTWVTRDGRDTPVDSTWNADVNDMALSPDGRRLAVAVVTGTDVDIWIKELDRGPLSRLTFGGRRYGRTSWSPDGRTVFYLDSGKVFSKKADGTGAVSEPIKAGNLVWGAAELSPDGRRFVLRGLAPRDIYTLAVSGDTALHPVATSPTDEYAPMLSPNGKLIAYVSEETGRPEIYIRPFPNSDSTKWQVSTAGGTEPVWAHSGRELFFVNRSYELMSATISTASGLSVTSPRVLFSVSRFARALNHRLYAVSPDDQRFAMVRLGTTSTGNLVMVENWFEQLKSKLKP